MLAVVLASCAGQTTGASTPTREGEATALAFSPEPTVTPATTLAPAATLAPVPTPQARPRITSLVGGMELASVDGPADLRIDPAISRDDEAVIAATVAGDIDAVQREFARPFSQRPRIYVFATNEALATMKPSASTSAHLRISDGDGGLRRG